MTLPARAPLTRHIEDAEVLIKHSRRRGFKKNSFILTPKSELNALMYIIKGSVTVSIHGDDGGEIIVAYLNQGDFIGELGFFDRKTSRDAYVKAKIDCELAVIEYDQFETLAREYPELMFAICRQLTRRLADVTRKAGSLAFLDVSGRVASALLDLSKQPDAITHPDGMQIKITRQEIGRLVGCSREMVGRVIKALELQGLVEAVGQTMVVHGTR